MSRPVPRATRSLATILSTALLIPFSYVFLLALALVSLAPSPVVAGEGDYVVLLHGIARSSAHMQPLADCLDAQGYEVINLDYPSTERTLSELGVFVTRQLAPRLDQDKPVHLVGYSMGALLARVLATQHRPRKLARVLQLAPPNRGSEVADFFSGVWLYSWIYGPAGQELGTRPSEVVQRRNALLGDIDFELGVLAGNASIDPFSSWLIPGEDDGKVSVASTRVTGMADHRVVDATHTFFPSNAEVLRQSVYFLREGHFIHGYERGYEERGHEERGHEERGYEGCE